MPTAKIQFKGITHNVSDNLCQDGELSECINLRNKNGSLQSVYETKELLKVTGQVYDKVIIHRNGDYANWIGYKYDDGIYWFATNDSEGKPIKAPIRTKLSAIDVTNIEQMGNILIVINTDGMFYFFFKDGGYVAINGFPFPIINIKPVLRSANSNPTTTLTGYTDNDMPDFYVSQILGFPATSTNDLVGAESIKVEMKNLRGMIAELQSKLDDNGWLWGYRMVRYAIRLYDGSYINHSAPILIAPPRGLDEQFITKPSAWDVAIYFVSLYKLQATWAATTDFNNLKGIVDGIDMFISQEIVRPDYDNDYCYRKNTVLTGSVWSVPEIVPSAYVDSDTLEPAPMYRFYDKAAFIDNIKDNSLFYKIKSLSIAELTAGGTGVVIDTKETRDILVTKEQLPDDDYTHNKIIPSATYMYNQKLHTGNIKTTLFGGYSPLLLASQSFASTLKFMFEVQIRTSEGLKNVFSDIVPSGAPISLIHPLIGYPDYRADKITQWGYMGGFLYKREFALAKHNNLNYAYYLNAGLSPINILDIGAMTLVEAAPSDCLEGMKAETTNIETTPEKIKVSKVSNPFYFAAENTYSANSQIVGFRSVNESVSEGTAFGTQPLYVFTKDGIKLMEVGTGSVYYTRMIDGPREVCVSGKSILSLGSGIVFASERGLLYLSGLTVKCISEQLRGLWADNMMSDSKVVKALTDPRISTLDTIKTSCSFDDIFASFLTIEEMAYNDKENEIIVVADTPSGVRFAYVYREGLWHVAQYKIKAFIKSYADLCYLRSDDAANTVIHDLKSETVPMEALIVTRAIKINPNTFKKFNRVFLRSAVRAGNEHYIFPDNVIADDERYQRLLVYGSNDCVRWSLLGGNDINGVIRSLGTRVAHTSCKYVRFVYCGLPWQFSQFDYLELDFEEVMNNKLR